MLSKTFIYNPTIRKLSLNGIHSKIVRVETTDYSLGGI
jgi:hypothetical protein